MKVEAFNFNLPDANIALRPAIPRDSARLLCVSRPQSRPHEQTPHPKTNSQITDKIITDLPNLLAAGDVLVVNDTKVIPARLEGIRIREGANLGVSEGRAKIEITLIERLEAVKWRCLLKPAKRVKVGDIIHFSGLKGEIVSRRDAPHGGGGEAEIIFQIPPEEMETALTQTGAMPLPPYIATKRKPDARDNSDYQTLFALHDGAVAAPTAGLHFTPALRDALIAKGVKIVTVTLHVGAGTFLPMKVDDTHDHVMHSEWGEITDCAAQQINAAKAAGGALICVGTTSLRLIESAAATDGKIAPFCANTDIFITPGYRFKATDRLLTNFHLPKSTLFMLVSAFSGLDEMKTAYTHAIKTGYRFYSYGDACLLDCAKQETL